MALAINSLTNATVFIDGTGLLGRCDEFTLPKPTMKYAEYKPLGLIGSTELPTGFDKMEATIKWNSFYKDVLRRMGDHYQSYLLLVRASLEEYTGGSRTGQAAVEVYMRVQAKDLNLGVFTQHERVMPETTFNVTYLKIVIGGEEIYELDLLNNVYKVDGSDRAAAYRRNLGIN